MKSKYTIRRNSWDNWYGYRSGRRVIEFFAGLEKGTQEQQAKEWLREMCKTEAIAKATNSL